MATFENPHKISYSYTQKNIYALIHSRLKNDTHTHTPPINPHRASVINRHIYDSPALSLRYVWVIISTHNYEK